MRFVWLKRVGHLPHGALERGPWDAVLWIQLARNQNKKTRHLLRDTRVFNNFKKVAQKHGGDGEIRTHDTGLSPYASLAGKCLRPLGHVS